MFHLERKSKLLGAFSAVSCRAGPRSGGRRGHEGGTRGGGRGEEGGVSVWKHKEQQRWRDHRHWVTVLNGPLCQNHLPRFYSVAVSTPALHAAGPGFESQRDHRVGPTHLNM